MLNGYIHIQEIKYIDQLIGNLEMRYTMSFSFVGYEHSPDLKKHRFSLANQTVSTGLFLRWLISIMVTTY